MSANVPANAPQGQAVTDLRIVERRGLERARLLAGAERELELIITELRRVEDAGGRINVALVARLAGVTRDTIYSRLRAARSENTTNRKDPHHGR